MALPAPINFFGTQYSHVFVNIDGNVSFEQPVGGNSPFVMSANSPPIIAPFLTSTHIVPLCEGSPIPFCEDEDLKTRIYYSDGEVFY